MPEVHGGTVERGLHLSCAKSPCKPGSFWLTHSSFLKVSASQTFGIRGACWKEWEGRGPSCCVTLSGGTLAQVVPHHTIQSERRQGTRHQAQKLPGRMSFDSGTGKALESPTPLVWEANILEGSRAPALPCTPPTSPAAKGAED